MSPLVRTTKSTRNLARRADQDGPCGLSLAGEFENGGREYQPKGSAVPVNVHDFMDKQLGKAIPLRDL